MALQDTPISNTPYQMEDLPFTVPPVKSTSEEARVFLAVQASMLDSYLNNTNPAENFQRYSRSSDPEEDAKILAGMKSRMDRENLLDSLVENPYSVNSSAEETVEATRRALQLNDEVSEDVDIQSAEAMMGTGTTAEDIPDVAARMKMFKLLADWQEDVGLSDQVMDMGKLFTIPFLESIRGTRITGRYFGQEEAIQGMISAFRAKPFEEQLAILPALKAELEDKVGKVAATQIISSFVQPFGAEDFDRFGSEEFIFDVLDATGIGYAFTGVLRNAKAANNLVRNLRRLKNEEGATNIATGAVLDPEIARAAGLDDVTATANALPFEISDIVPGRTDGLSGKVLRELEEFAGETNRLVEDIVAGNGFLREGVLNTKERARAEARAESRFLAEKAEDIEIVEQGTNHTTFSYRVADPDTGELSERTHRLELQLNDAGTFEQSTTGLIREFIGSPTAFARGMLREDVATAQRAGDYLNSRIRQALLDQTRKAIAPIGLIPTPAQRARLARVDNALVQGDEFKNLDGTRGKVFTPDELRSQFGLNTEGEISSYYRVRQLYDNLWELRNSEKRAEMTALGYRHVTLDSLGEASAGKVFEDEAAAITALRNNKVHMIWDAEEGRAVDLRSAGDDFLSNSYFSGKRVARLEGPVDAGEGLGKYQHVLVDSTAVGDLPRDVLRRKEGYVPRIYEDATHFVYEMYDDLVDGTRTLSQTRTLRFFDGKKDADTYVEELVRKDVSAITAKMTEEGATAEDIAAAAARAETQARGRYVALGDRERERLAAASGDVGHGSDGLYTGARAEDDILFGLEGERAARVNSFEALTRNIGNLSRYVSINQWRLGLEQRWINTANEILQSKGVSQRVTSFERLPAVAEASMEVRFLNHTYDQIRTWQNFPTPSEQFFQTTVQQLYDWSKSKDLNRTAKFLGNFRSTDPVASARAAAFHSLLGFFNPSQLWVQAQGAAIAASLGFGKYLTRTIINSTSLGYLDVGVVDSARIGRVAKAAGIDKDELEAIHNLWVKSGYRDSVLQTADHAAAAKGYGLTMDAIKRTADAGLLFYRQGELFNRRMSFATAIERFKERTGKTSIVGISDAEYRTILDDANNMMLNMTKANAAPWQRGIPSLPTQFLQVTTKFAETALGFNQNFTPMERGRLIFGQLALYGMGGIPLAGIPIMLAMEVFGMTQEDIDNNPAFVKAVNDGFWGVTAYQIFGVDIEMSSRGSLLRGIGDFIDTWMLEESTMIEKMLGPFGSTQNRFFDEFFRRLRPFTPGNWADVDFSDAGALLVSPVLSSMSSWSNLEKAMYMNRLAAIYNRRGRLVDSRDFSFMEEVAQAIGFQPTSTTEIWDLNERSEANERAVKRITDEVLIHMNRFALEYPNADYDDAALEEYERGMRMLMVVLDPAEQVRVHQAVQQAVSRGSAKNAAANRYIQNMKENTVQDLELWKTTLIGNKIIRVDSPREEQQ